MIKLILIRVALFFLPFVFYALYLKYVKRVRLDDPAHWTPVRLTWLVIVSITVVAVSFFIMAAQAPKGGDYVPAEYRDGELVPGRVDPNAETP